MPVRNRSSPVDPIWVYCWTSCTNIGTRLRAAIVGAFLYLFTTPICEAAEPLAGIVSVIDGGTIELHGERIRLNGIDVPESAKTLRGASCRLGQKTIRCEADKRDRYRRLIVACYLGNEDLQAWDTKRLLTPQPLGLLNV